MQLNLGDGNRADVQMANYLRADKIRDGDIATFLDAGGMREAVFKNGEKRNVIEFHVEVMKENYVWTMNNQTLEALGKSWGTNCRQWIGKQCKLNLVKMNVFGTMKNIIIGEPLVETERVRGSYR